VLYHGEDIFSAEIEVEHSDASRDGVPESQPVSQVDLMKTWRWDRRQSTGSGTADAGWHRRAVPCATPRSGRGQGPAARERVRAVRRQPARGCASRAACRSEPDVLLLDEPTSALDPVSSYKVGGPGRQAEGAVQRSHRHALHAAGQPDLDRTAFFPVRGRSWSSTDRRAVLEPVRPAPKRTTSPADLERTGRLSRRDYVHTYSKVARIPIHRIK
jgi:hypothetical protein